MFFWRSFLLHEEAEILIAGCGGVAQASRPVISVALRAFGFLLREPSEFGGSLPTGQSGGLERAAGWLDASSRELSTADSFIATK